MKSIWKFPTNNKENANLELPKGAKILSSINQFGENVVYAMVNPKEIQKENMVVNVLNTNRSNELYNKSDLTEHVLVATDLQTIELPRGSRIVLAETKGDDICLYTDDTNEIEKETRQIRVHGTGHPIPDTIDEFQFLRTVPLFGGSLVFHVFYN